MWLGGQSWLDEHDIRRSTNMDIRFLSMDAGKDQSKSDLQTVQLASVHNTFVHESRIAHFGKPGWREGSLNIQSKLLGVLAAARPQWQSEQHTAQCQGANVKRETRRRASANAQPREHRNLENIRITSAALANKEDACARAPRVFNPLSPMHADARYILSRFFGVYVHGWSCRLHSHRGNSNKAFTRQDRQIVT